MNRYTNRQEPRGFTFFELMVAILCFSLISIPLWLTFRWGSQSAHRGILQVETTLEAQRVIRQVQNDLKAACIPQDAKTLAVSFDQIVSEGWNPRRYSFLVFPHEEELDQSIPQVNAGRAFTRANRVTYTLTPNKDNPFFSLDRTVIFNRESPLHSTFPGGNTKTLSRKVNLFSVRPFYLPGESPGGDNKGMPGWFEVTLQLVDSLNRNFPREIAGTPPPTGQFVIADFFEVVYPEFYNRLFSGLTFNRNWQSGIQGPP